MYIDLIIFRDDIGTFERQQRGGKFDTSNDTEDFVANDDNIKGS